MVSLPKEKQTLKKLASSLRLALRSLFARTVTVEKPAAPRPTAAELNLRLRLKGGI